MKRKSQQKPKPEAVPTLGVIPPPPPEKKILPEFPEAAEYKTVTGWVSRLGNYFGPDEKGARKDGCTHMACPACGAINPKTEACRPCFQKAGVVAYANRPVKKWDKKTPLFSLVQKTVVHPKALLKIKGVFQIFNSLAVVEQLVIAVPNHASPVDPYDIFLEAMAGNRDLPKPINKMFRELNKKIMKCKEPLGWSPGPFAVKL